MSEVGNDDIIFLMEVSDGYSFRNMIEHLKATNVDGHFVFSKKGINYQRIDANHILMNELYLRACDFQKYVLNVTDTVHVGVNLSDFQSITKQIGKRDGFRWYKKSYSVETSGTVNTSNSIYCQILNSSKNSRSNINFFCEKNINIEQYEAGKFRREIDNPNANCVIGDFSKTCKTIGSLKCDSVIIQGYSKGVSFTACNQGNITGRVEQFGICELEPKIYPELSDILNGTINLNLNGDDGSSVSNQSNGTALVHVPSSVIKSLGKMNNICNNGIVKMYLEQDKPFRIICPIGPYGELTIYIRDINSKEE